MTTTSAADAGCSSRDVCTEREHPTSSSIKGSVGQQQSNWQLLLELPPDLFTRSILKFLTSQDKKAFRMASRLCRSLINAGTAACSLSVCCPTTLQAVVQVPHSFPQLCQVSICHVLDNSNDNSSSQQQVPGEIDVAVQQQLPRLLQQLPHLSSFSYEGPINRREQSLDLLPALKALAAAAAAAMLTAGYLEMTQCHSGHGALTESQLQAQQQQRQQLTKLSLRAAKLPDSFLDAIGQLRHLRSLQLTATTAIATAPLSQLQQLTEVQLTVTPPLIGALAPLAGLKNLQVLRLAAISPARGWAAALRLLQGCNLQELEVVFADICDDDVAALGELKGLTRLDLHCSRHLTSAAAPHIAQLPRLSALHLGDTGLRLGATEMQLLGSGCPQLTELHAEFDLWLLPHAADLPASHSARSRATVLTSNLEQQLILQAETVAIQDEVVPWPPISYLHAVRWFGSMEFAKMLHRCAGLKRLELDDVGPGADGVTATLAAFAPQITALKLAGCNSLTLRGCTIIADGLKCLQELELVGLHSFGLAQLLQHTTASLRSQPGDSVVRLALASVV